VLNNKLTNHLQTQPKMDLTSSQLHHLQVINYITSINRVT